MKPEQRKAVLESDKVVTKEDLLWAVQRSVTMFQKFASENPEKPLTFKQWVRGESRDMVEVIEQVTKVKP